MSADATAGAPAQTYQLHFPLQDNERVLMLCRRHWLFLWPRVIFVALVAIVPPIVISVILAQLDLYEGTTAQVFWIAAALWILWWGAGAVLTWYRYNNDVWVITNQRLIDSVKTTPFSLKMSTADLVNVQDMTVERSGIVRTIFDFGDVICDTASGTGDFRISGIPNPREVQALVDRERDRERMRPG